MSHTTTYGLTITPWDASWNIEGPYRVYDFQLGDRTGYAARCERKPEKWIEQQHYPAKPERWQVTLHGDDGSWLAVTLPIKRGRTLRSAIADAVAAFPMPTIRNGCFGSFAILH